MSIGIAIATENTVLLVADGRRTNAYSVLTDKAEKVSLISDSLAVIEFGVEISSSAALEQLRRSTTALSTGHNISTTIRNSVHESGISILNEVIPDSTDMSRIKVGLVAGGIDDEGTYLCGALFGHGMNEPAGQFVRPSPGQPQFILLGGESVGAKEYFVGMANRALTVSGKGSQGLLVMLQRAAKKTVQYAANRDQTIGGRVQYRILRRGQPPYGGFL